MIIHIFLETMLFIVSMKYTCVEYKIFCINHTCRAGAIIMISSYYKTTLAIA